MVQNTERNIRKSFEEMRLIFLACMLILSGCGTPPRFFETRDQQYYETVKSISRDITVSQTACWAAVTEIAKTSDSTVKAMAIALAEKCKTDSTKLLPDSR